jgi:copper(I)-binding protein
MRNRIVIAVLLVLGSICGASAAELTVSDAWIRALPRSVPSGGYFTLHNGGTKPVTLTGASSPACGMLMLHKSENHGGMGSMMDADMVDVPAGASVRFAPGGYHLMCTDAGPAIKPGATVPVSLIFNDGKKLAVNFQVRNALGK